MKKKYLQTEISERESQLVNKIRNLSQKELLQFGRYGENEDAEKQICSNIAQEFLFKKVSITEIHEPSIDERIKMSPQKFRMGPYNRVLSGNYIVDIITFGFEFENFITYLPEILFTSFNKSEYIIMENMRICKDIEVHYNEVKLVLIPININSMNHMPKCEEVIELIKSVSQKFKEDIKVKIKDLNVELEKVNSDLLKNTSEAIKPMIMKAVEKQKSEEYLKLI